MKTSKCTLRARVVWLLLLLMLVAAAEAEDFTYTISAGKVTITGYVGVGGTISIPDTIEGLPVGAIHDYAFSGHKGLTGVTIPNSVTSIGFMSFKDCPSLGSIAMPVSVRSIGNFAFSGCTGLVSVTVGDSVSDIGYGVFWGCTSLGAISVPAVNSSYSSVDGVLFNKSQTVLIACPGGKSGSYTIPASVTSIGPYALVGCASLTSVAIPNGVTVLDNFMFEGCTSLATVTIPDSVTYIGDRAFKDCTSLTGVAIGNNVTFIADQPFEGCTSLVAINVAALNSTYSSLDGVLFNKSQSVLIACPAGKAGNYAVPNSVTLIDVRAFKGCASLASVTIPDSVTEIGPEAFSGCASLASVDIPHNVTSIGMMAFEGCTGLATVTIGNGVAEIFPRAFSDCSSLGAINVAPLNPSYSSRDGVLFNISQTMLVTYPGGNAGNYIIPDSVTSIGDFAFRGCASLASVTIPSSVTWIGFHAFYACTTLTGVYFEGKAPPFGGSLFDGSPTIYHLSEVPDWGESFAERPTAMWRPRAEPADPSFGLGSGQFRFNILWARRKTVVVERSEDLNSSIWTEAATLTLPDGISVFTDPDWRDRALRLYRLRSP